MSGTVTRALYSPSESTLASIRTGKYNASNASAKGSPGAGAMLYTGTVKSKRPAVTDSTIVVAIPTIVLRGQSALSSTAAIVQRATPTVVPSNPFGRS